MSINRGVFILEFNDGFRVAYTEDIDNFESVKSLGEDSSQFKSYVKKIWGSSKVFETEEEAVQYAVYWKMEQEEIAETTGEPFYLEYGIRKMQGIVLDPAILN